MKALASRLFAAVLVAIAAVMALVAASAPSKPLEPGKLVILSTVDVKGKTSPCG